MNDKTAAGTFTAVIVRNIRKPVVGMAVDGVSDVMSLTTGQLRPVPEFPSTLGRNGLLAMVSLENRMMIFADVGLVAQVAQ